MSDSISQYYRVLEYTPAMQTVQGMETRDFQYKGIFKVFMTISEWTDRYLTNKILPNIDQLSKETSIEKEKIEFFIQELCFKGSSPLVKKITTVEFDPMNTHKSEMVSSILRRNTVFARPPTLDASSAQRYVNGCNESSVAAIKKAISQNRIPWTSNKFADFIFSKINANKLSDTYASADIANLFNCPYDTTKTLKEATINSHLKPVLKKLVDDKVLLFFRNENASKSSNKSIFLYNNKEEIFERIDIYVSYLKKNIIPNFQKIGVIGQVSEEDYQNYTKLASNILKYMDESYGDQKHVVEELIILGSFHESYKEEQAKKEQREKLLEILNLLENAGKITDIKAIRLQGKPIPKDLVSILISNENILYTEYDDGNNLFEFVLHKKCIPLAIEHAKKIYEATENDVDLRILSRMNVYEHLNPDQKRDFVNIETTSLFKYLPFFTRLWRLLFGNIYITKEEAEKIKVQKEIEQKKRIEASRAKAIAEEKAKLVQERMKQREKESTAESVPLINLQNTEATMQALEQERKLKEFLKDIIKILDEAWDNQLQPDREYLMSQLQNTSMTEDELINHLKKNFSKEILSFQVKSATGSSPYKWPILISRSYLKRNGNKLLQLAKKESDAERNSSAPNQTRFDFYSSLEDFLERVLPKI